jgi:signal transduction histidine kinase
VDARANLSKSVGRIQRAGAAMHRLIDNLLDLGRVRAGEFQLRLESHQIEELLREAFEQAAPLAEQRGIQLRKVAAPSAELTCDRDRVLQVLANLLGNAIKFSREGDVVTLSATCTDVACTFEVSDTGPGIPPERLPYLFDRYWQAPDVTERGSGLGLAIAKAFVELHGGTIHCESQPNHGARFFFVLPKAAKVA